MRLRAAFPAAALVSSAVLLAACSSSVDGAPSGTPTPDALTSGAPTSGAPTSGVRSCPADYLPPDPDRPRVRLAFTIDAGLHTVHGTEHVRFTPDRPITELVFRLTANTAPTVAAGNRIEVTAADAGPGSGPFRFTSAGADPATQGGLLRIPFGSTVPAGTTVTADVAFTLTLGGERFDRFGSLDSAQGHYAWFGSAQPLLAWERGYGWHEENLLQFTAESATSEAMDTDLTVTAPSGQNVIMSGLPADPVRDGNKTVWRSHGDALRDVSVAVGPFRTSDTDVDGVRLRLGAFSATERDRLVPEFERAIRELVKRYGPFPYPSLSVARPPVAGGGIEYPSSIILADSSTLVAVHETAHMYFYGMVGDSQAQHPWLDEAFATMSQQLIDGQPQSPSVLADPHPVDATTESYGTDDQSYFRITYDKGAAALEAAREAAGPAAFDAALRCYVAANAWTIADPADVQAALQGLPAAVQVLRDAGALP